MHAEPRISPSAVKCDGLGREDHPILLPEKGSVCGTPWTRDRRSDMRSYEETAYDSSGNGRSWCNAMKLGRLCVSGPGSRWRFSQTGGR